MASNEEMTAYQQFFKKALKKHGVSSPADFKTDAEKKKFFNYVEKEWKGTDTMLKDIQKNPAVKKAINKELGLEEVDNEFTQAISEANAFLKARAVAMWEGKKKFEFNGKTYPVIKVEEEN